MARGALDMVESAMSRKFFKVSIHINLQNTMEFTDNENLIEAQPCINYLDHQLRLLKE